MSSPLPRLYAIVDVDTCSRRRLAPEAVIDAYLGAGIRLLQVRAKQAGGRALLALVDYAVAAARPLGASIVVNDRVDIAALTHAGVHVGQDDLPAVTARQLLGPAGYIGRSTHDVAQVTAALAEPVDYIAFGPIFATASKDNPDPVVGLDGLRAAARLTRAAGRPLVAIGGITAQTAPQVLAAGADSVAVIGALLDGDDAPGVSAARFVVALSRAAV